MKAVTKSFEHQNYDQVVTQLKNNLQTWALQRGVAYASRWENLHQINNDKIMLVYLGDLLPSSIELHKLDQRLGQAGKSLLVIWDGFSQHQFDNIKIFTHSALWGLNRLHVDSAAITTTNNPSKLYNCFMHRIDPGRQSWFYFLYLNGLLDQGHVSFLLYQLPSVGVTGVELFDKNHREYLDTLPHFCEAYQQLRSKVPYQNFTENQSLVDKIVDSRYSLILDTYAAHDENGAWFASEPVYRALMLPTIELVFSQKHLVSKLKELKLEFYSDLEEIDQLHWTQRQQRLIEILKSDSIDYHYGRLKEKALYNCSMLESMLGTMPDFEQQVQNILQNFDFR